MATVTTTITPTQAPFALAGLPDPERDHSMVPRREMRLYTLAAPIALTGVGDNQQVNIIANLPRNFAWRLIDLSFRIFPGAGDTNGFPASCLGLIGITNDALSAQLYYPFEMSRTAVAMASNIEYFAYRPLQLPREVWLPPEPNGVVQVGIYMYNTTANDVGYTLDFYGRALEYGVEQAHHWEVNTPQPVVSM